MSLPNFLTSSDLAWVEAILPSSTSRIAQLEDCATKASSLNGLSSAATGSAVEAANREEQERTARLYIIGRRRFGSSWLESGQGFMSAMNVPQLPRTRGVSGSSNVYTGDS